MFTVKHMRYIYTLHSIKKLNFLGRPELLVYKMCIIVLAGMTAAPILLRPNEYPLVSTMCMFSILTIVILNSDIAGTAVVIGVLKVI